MLRFTESKESPTSWLWLLALYFSLLLACPGFMWSSESDLIDRISEWFQQRSKALTRSNLQRIALLEQEVEEALKEEERQKDRIHAAQLLCRRPISADHDNRPLYTKHKISYPLSCPGMLFPDQRNPLWTKRNMPTLWSLENMVKSNYMWVYIMLQLYP